MRSILLWSLATLVVFLGGASYASAGTICPQIDLTALGGADPGGTTNCNVIFTINQDLSLTVTTPSLIPYESIEDQLVGVLNNSAGSISSLTVSGPNDLFGFDGDGVCGGYALTGCGAGDSTGYAREGDTFTDINLAMSSGTINFGTPIAGGGGFTFFSLELAPSEGAGLGGSVGGPVPEPSSLLLLGSGLFGIATFFARKKVSSI